MKYLSIVFILLNIISFIMMGIDKRKAIKGKWRVPEKKLWMVAFFGGSIGILIAMRTFSHKTKHRTFTIGIPIMSLINAVEYFVLLSIFEGNL